MSQQKHPYSADSKSDHQFTAEEDQLILQRAYNNVYLAKKFGVNPIDVSKRRMYLLSKEGN